MFKRMFFMTFIFAMLALLYVPAFAQADTPVEAVPSAEGAIGLAEVLIAAVLASAFGTAPITAFVVQLLKPVLPTVSARAITAVVALLLSAITAVATHLGYGVQFNSLIEAVSAAGPAIVGFIVTLIGAPAYYKAAQAVDAPVLSYSRTPEPQ